MDRLSLDYPCPAWLEDEALLIERSGEMPEVALAESLQHLGELPPGDLACLRAACARGYIANMRRDLKAEHVGAPHYRGLERALANLARLEGFLAKLGEKVPPALITELAVEMGDFLAAEARALNAGRPYAAAPPQEVRALAAKLGLSLEPWDPLLSRMSRLPAPDFLGLRALQRLRAPGVAGKRRRLRGDNLRIEILDPAGRVLAAAALPWQSDVAAVAEENRARAEMVWELLPLPPQT
ncbi:hypothetical protein AAU61_18865 [Desulfocarbo indianensis]|nr:hypothetical protein AAU61_18865 [Desulfocarbo indianensis]